MAARRLCMVCELLAMLGYPDLGNPFVLAKGYKCWIGWRNFAQTHRLLERRAGVA